MKILSAFMTYEEEERTPGPADKDLTLRNVETHHIARAMEMAGGKVEGENGAAAILGMKPGTLRHRMRKLGIPFGRVARAG